MSHPPVKTYNPTIRYIIINALFYLAIIIVGLISYFKAKEVLYPVDYKTLICFISFFVVHFLFNILCVLYNYHEWDDYLYQGLIFSLVLVLIGISIWSYIISDTYVWSLYLGEDEFAKIFPALVAFCLPVCLLSILWSVLTLACSDYIDWSTSFFYYLEILNLILAEAIFFVILYFGHKYHGFILVVANIVGAIGIGFISLIGDTLVSDYFSYSGGYSSPSYSSPSYSSSSSYDDDDDDRDDRWDATGFFYLSEAIYKHMFDCYFHAFIGCTMYKDVLSVNVYDDCIIIDVDTHYEYHNSFYRYDDEARIKRTLIEVAEEELREAQKKYYNFDDITDITVRIHTTIEE